MDMMLVNAKRFPFWIGECRLDNHRREHRIFGTYVYSVGMLREMTRIRRSSDSEIVRLA